MLNPLIDPFVFAASDSLLRRVLFCSVPLRASEFVLCSVKCGDVPLSSTVYRLVRRLGVTFVSSFV